MAGERLPVRFSLRSQLWFRWTGKRSETAYFSYTNRYLQCNTDIIIINNKYDKKNS